MNHRRYAVGPMAALAAIVLSGAPAVAAPAHRPSSADVTVLQQIVIHQDTNLDFGKIDKPRTAFRTFVVNTDGTHAVTTPGSGTLGAFIGGDHPGQYDITGTPGEVMVITTFGGACTAPGITLTSIDNDLGPAPHMLNIVDMRVGGKLAVAPSAPAGHHTCPYVIQAHY